MAKKSALVALAPLALVIILVPVSGFEGTEVLMTISIASDLSHLMKRRDLQKLGEQIFLDKNLSTPPGQSCAACHGPQSGWTGPDDDVNRSGAVYAGAMPERFGNRKPPSAAYASPAPFLHIEEEDGERLFVGGNFWDGRATGWKLGNPAADQAQGPFLNPVEQNNPNAKTVVDQVFRSDYAELFRRVCSDIWGIRNIDKDMIVEMAYGIIALAIAAFESSDQVNQFTSKYDYFLRGRVALTPQERRGLELFEGKGKCGDCHPHKPGPNGEPPLFTDFTYDNLGFPINPLNPWYTMPSRYNPEGPAWVDLGLGGFLRQVPQFAMFASENDGKHRVPTLRNVDKRPSPDFVKAYGHNGYFKSLEEITHFYNKRDALPCCGTISDPQLGVNCWPEPEVLQNVNRDELGDLKLTPEEEAAIVDFMKTLSDGYNLP